MQLKLFSPKLTLPPGFVYKEDFLSHDLEEGLLEEFKSIEFGEFTMHGVTAKRQVKIFGDMFSRDTGKHRGHRTIPDFLLDLRKNVAAYAQTKPETFKMILITKYPPGAPIGWHRDASPYGFVAGVSLSSTAIMRLRPLGGKKEDIMRIELEPRSIYVMRGPARSEWQHSILPTKDLRYSITFRTVKGW